MVVGVLQDDGIGFAVDQVLNQKGLRGLGLLGMQERVQTLGGLLQITSTLGQGTTLQIMLPIAPEEASSGTDCTWADPSLRASTSRHGMQ
jgi:signal transduction histidine kinase